MGGEMAMLVTRLHLFETETTSILNAGWREKCQRSNGVMCRPELKDALLAEAEDFCIERPFNCAARHKHGVAHGYPRAAVLSDGRRIRMLTLGER